MGFTIKYCDVCQTRVPDKDLQSGDAVEVGNRTFCREHRGEANVEPERTRLKKGARRSERTAPVSVSPERTRLGRGSGRVAATSSRRSAPLSDDRTGDADSPPSRAPVLVVTLTLLAAIVAVIVIVAQPGAGTATSGDGSDSRQAADTRDDDPANGATGTGTGDRPDDGTSNAGTATGNSSDPDDPPVPPSGARLTVTLHDGTRLVGHVETPALGFRESTAGWIDVDPGDIDEARFQPDGAVRLRLRSGAGGDATGRFREDRLTLQTRLGHVELRFDEVAAIRRGNALPPADPLPARTRRIATPDDGALAGCIRIGFDRDPVGTPLVPGQNINDVFVARGVKLRTSIAQSYVAVDDWPIRSSESKGVSCANREPRWQGQLSIIFCVPGEPQQVACVTRVGLWISQVAPNGTWLEARDVHDRVITRIPTVAKGDDFLALESRTPIARVVLVPNPEIDRDFTIDDLTFDPPAAHPEAGHADRVLVTLRDGLRVHATDIAVADGQVTLREPAHGDSRVTVPRSELAGVVWPTRRPPGPRPGEFFLRTADGSILRAFHEADSLLIARTGKPVPPGSLVALWGNATPYAEPATGQALVGERVLLLHGRAKVESERWQFDNGHVVIDDEAQGRRLRLPLPAAPVLWFRGVPRPSADSGRVWLTTGEELVLANDGYRITEWSASGLVLAGHGATLMIPTGDLAAIRLPER